MATMRSRPITRPELAKLTTDPRLQKALEDSFADTAVNIPEAVTEALETATEALDLATTTKAQAYILVSPTPALPSARGFGVGPGLSLSDGGAGGVIAVVLQAFLQSLSELTGNGIVVKTIAGAQLRAIEAGSSRIEIMNGDGTTGNPAIDIDEPSLDLGNMGGTLGIAHGGTGVTVQSAFSAHNNGTTQPVADSVFVKLNMSTEVFDLNGNFAASAWTPPAGRPVLLTGAASVVMSLPGAVSVAIFKNGVQFRNGTVLQADASTEPSATVTCFDVPNGTDVYDLRVIQNSGVAQATNGLQPLTWFMGSML